MRLVVLILGLLLAIPAMAGTIYTWRDANGVVHYSDHKPPISVKYSTQAAGPSMSPAEAVGADIGSSPVASSSADTTAPTVANVHCVAARNSISALTQNGSPVMMDLSGDGKPVPLTEEMRARQLTLARASEAAYCTP